MMPRKCVHFRFLPLSRWVNILNHCCPRTNYVKRAIEIFLMVLSLEHCSIDQFPNCAKDIDMTRCMIKLICQAIKTKSQNARMSLITFIYLFIFFTLSFTCNEVR